VIYPTAGWPVLFYKSPGMKAGGDPGAPAIVTKAGTEGAMNLLVSGEAYHTPRFNVRHIADPWHMNFPGQSAQDGCWDYNPQFPAEGLALFRLLNEKPEVYEALRAILEATDIVADAEPVEEALKPARGRGAR
jgi:hypothetical protein